MADKKYIEVGELKEWIENFFKVVHYYHPYSKSRTLPESELFDILERMPAADVVEWNVIHKRPMTEEERTEWSERLGYDVEYGDAFIYSNLPNDGEVVLVSSEWGNVSIDTFHQDQDEGCYFEENGDMDGIVAWMPLPVPYKKEKNDDKL